ncbi:septum formation inhibitor Maf [Altibacter sp.]|uniref:septum formation inhibitor Maf n=1 Tax=Altibacter sp. TaxID=2024823 RepID=UPI00258B1B78|nr:septum formation inhibitor Maf [Altibacter sp.]MCW9037683.1 septum formation inhibitor Maf [Altibacter sp.]
MKYPFFVVLLTLITLSMLLGCKNKENDSPLSGSTTHKTEEQQEKRRTLTDAFKEYWFSGVAEITSYQLSQERYGELREGTAVNIFVTEDFLPKAQVKANSPSEETLAVLKLNSTKNFVTGIYPYAIMTSVFSPIETQGHAQKISHSVQEWCGQVYMQLNNQKNFEIISHSYFEGEADQEFTLERTWLENELWNIIRINPEELPTGDVSVIPAFEYLRLRHKEAAAHPAFASLKQGDSLTSYTVNYPNLQRQITWYFTSRFPYEIEKWEETNATDPNDTLRLKTTAVKMKRIRTPYWTQNRNKDQVLRDSLGLR